jgi:hypothetical protein
MRLAGGTYIHKTDDKDAAGNSLGGTTAGQATVVHSNPQATYTADAFEALLPPLPAAVEPLLEPVVAAPAAPAPPAPTGASTDAPPLRQYEELERLVAAYPTIYADNEQYQEARDLCAGLIRCFEAIGRSRREAVALMSRYHPQADDCFEGVEKWDFTKYSIDSFIAQCRSKRVDVSRHDLPRHQPADPPEDADPGAPFDLQAVLEGRATGNSHQAPQPAPGQAPQGDIPPLSYSDLIGLTLQAIRDGDEDLEMESRAVIQGRFKRTDSQINTALFKRLTREELGGKCPPPLRCRPVDIDRVEGLDWLVDGFIPANDQAIVDAPGGGGKTTGALRLGFAVVDGTGFLDRHASTDKGRVLFIASDSGISPLRRTLEDLGLADHPAHKDPDRRFFVWAHAHEQGAAAWEASISGCLQLLHFVKEHHINLVIIDSCKAVTSKADVAYTDNQQVTALLTFFKEVVCQHCSVLWINHDGTQKGATAGAKAWREIPSIVHSIERIKVDRNEFGEFIPGAARTERDDLREWIVRKSRLGPTRQFRYSLDRDLGQFQVAPDVEIIKDCRQAILGVMKDAYREGRLSIATAELKELVRETHHLSHKTVENSLPRLLAGKAPDLVRPGTGRYALAPRLRQALDAEAKGTTWDTSPAS